MYVAEATGTTDGQKKSVCCTFGADGNLKRVEDRSFDATTSAASMAGHEVNYGAETIVMMRGSRKDVAVMRKIVDKIQKLLPAVDERTLDWQVARVRIER